MIFQARAPTLTKHRMLVFDSAYTFRIMQERNIAVLVTGRDLGGYFDHVWTCHPVASLLEPPGSDQRYGAPTIHDLAPRHTMIEGTIGSYRWLSWLPPLNFLIAQYVLIRVLMRLVRDHGLEVIRAEDPHYNGLLALIVARLSKLPLVVGVWGNPGAVRAVTREPLTPRLFRKVWIEEIVERFVLRRADLVLAQNEDNRAFVIRAGVPREKTAIFRIGNVIHEAHLTDPEKRASGKEELRQLGIGAVPILMCISRLQSLKLVDHLILVARTLKDRGRDVAVLLVGEGPFRADLEQLARKLCVADRTFFAGNRDQQWLSRVIASVDAVISPLTGRALAEAALGGAPIAAYDIDWHSELVETGVTGELVPYLDHLALAEASERLLSDRDYARRMGLAVRARAMEILDPAATDQAQIAAYEMLFDRPSR